MKFSIIPIIYLICLSIFLTPIACFVIFQLFKFNNNLLILNNYKQEKSKNTLNAEESYRITTIFMSNQSWHIALTQLENSIYQDSFMATKWQAKYYNAIGFILQKMEYYTLAKKYYIKSSKTDDTYKYAEKNLASLP